MNTYTTQTYGGRQRFLLLTVMWLTIVAAIAGVAAAGILGARRPEEPFALCQRSASGAAATTLIIIDATDPLSEDQRQRLRSAVEAESDRLPEGGRLVMLALNPHAPAEPAQVVAACNPGKGGTSNPLLVTRSKIEKRWREQFAGPVKAAMMKAAEHVPSERSPIIATIAASLARADFDARAKDRRLVLVSDLLEHDHGYTHLRGGDYWALYQGSALPRSVRLDLTGVTVAVDYLQRAKFAAVQGTRHQAFWMRLLKEAGASEVGFIGMTIPAAPSMGGR